jgi:membrane protease subunit HflC
LKSGDTRFLLRPDNDFFKFFNSASGVAASPTALPAPPKP